MCKFREEGKHIPGLIQADLLDKQECQEDDALTALRSWERANDFKSTSEFMIDPFEGIGGSTDGAQLLRQAEERDSAPPVSASSDDGSWFSSSPRATEELKALLCLFEGLRIVDGPEVALDGFATFLSSDDIQDVRQFMDQTALGANMWIILDESSTNAVLARSRQRHHE